MCKVNYGEVKSVKERIEENRKRREAKRLIVSKENHVSDLKQQRESRLPRNIFIDTDKVLNIKNANTIQECEEILGYKFDTLYSNFDGVRFIDGEEVLGIAKNYEIEFRNYSISVYTFNDEIENLYIYEY